ncbi:NAD(P)-binding protein [Panus rudis PR-1116 ss-1]|nr:NAD(P)-binding protein [Panus rudis PR-1116 ss-1]
MVSFVVTGGNRGIGLEFVRQLSANPDNVVFATTRNKGRSHDLLALQTHHQNLHILEADITDVKALKAAAQQVEKITGGTLDVLINNAALIPEDRVHYHLDDYANGQEELLEQDFITAFKINTIGVAHTINAFLPLLKNTSKTKTAKVITLSSGVADTDFTVKSEYGQATAYSVSKAATNMVVAKYAAEYKHENFVFLAISPGYVKTKNETPPPEAQEFIKKMEGHFYKAYPDWNGKALTPTESVKLQLGVFEKLTPKDTGAFISQYGDKRWL